MNWLGKRRKIGEGDRWKVVGDRDTTTQPLSPITCQLSPKSPLRAGIFAISLALFTAFLMIRTAAVVSSPQNFITGGGGQTNWTTPTSGATANVPISDTAYGVYESPTGLPPAGIDTSTGVIQLKSDSYAALQTSDCTVYSKRNFNSKVRLWPEVQLA